MKCFGKYIKPYRTAQLTARLELVPIQFHSLDALAGLTGEAPASTAPAGVRGIGSTFFAWAPQLGGAGGTLVPSAQVHCTSWHTEERGAMMDTCHITLLTHVLTLGGVRRRQEPAE